MTCQVCHWKEQQHLYTYLFWISLFISILFSTNSRGNHVYSFLQYLSLCINILESNTDIQEMRKLTLIVVLIR